MFKDVTRFSGGALLIVILALAVLYGINKWREKTSPEYEAEKYLQEQKGAYANDTYGGSTPEETLQLFVEALKKGDTDLAAKYFVLDKQEEWKKDLALIKEKGLLDKMIGDLGKAEKENTEENTARYFILNPNNESAPLVLVKNQNGKWKIRTL